MKTPGIVALPILLGALLLGGCATKSASVAPNVDLTTIKTAYVVRLAPDKRGINQVVADELALLGIRATTGEETASPPDVDAIVTYQDKWMWDITMYMLQLNVQIRDPKTRAVLASGESMRPSLERFSPPMMAREVLTEMFTAKPKGRPAAATGGAAAASGN